ncbi:sulfurtransferase TusA family protein [Sphingomonas sp. S1-29]|uniref:sulfurtransferase TusA family protein n=1 Tax=Sphingomonas sp. S1-29 TaxID=2991074 RepID=UPI00223F1081|nr:sulfurtransferase TusA family protein [Sphingomonas sp. S1-29]UZK70694.1 sulfurtransferase TusA family protein [Sphingomonas sp. S1-29]
MSGGPLRIDARGLKCPWPAIRLGRALRAGAAIVEIRADDPAAERELAALASACGAAFTQLESQLFCIERQAA